MGEFKDQNKVNDLFDYARHNKEQTITYIVLAFGLLLLFADRFFGGIIIGATVGYHFSNEIVGFLRNIQTYFSGKELVRSVVLAVLAICLLFISPGLFIGAFIVAGLKHLVFGNSEPTIGQ